MLGCRVHAAYGLWQGLPIMLFGYETALLVNLFPHRLEWDSLILLDYCLDITKEVVSFKVNNNGVLKRYFIRLNMWKQLLNYL